MQKIELTKRAAILLASITFLSGAVACGATGLVIKTWFLDATIPALIRKDASGNELERKSIMAADGYRCYSRVDDEAWRTAYGQAQACCNSKGN